MKTRDRIIHSATELFNDQGERNITTNHIAAHLGISPGNLYYHFRNKEDIIHSIFDQYARHLSESFTPARSEMALVACHLPCQSMVRCDGTWIRSVSFALVARL